MHESESFDAFYARTVSGITTEIHDLAGGDAQADHAIREAYARAYQQWYEVSGYRDPEGWVLDVAKEAFERRRAQVEPAAPPSPDLGSWPGYFRERHPEPEPVPADPAATIASQGRPAGSVASGGPVGQPEYDEAATVSPAAAALVRPDQPGASSFPEDAAQPGQIQAAPMPGRTAYVSGLRGDTAIRSAGRRPGLPSENRALLAVIAVIAIVALGVGGYLAFGRSKGGTGPGPTASAGAGAKPTVQMLPAGATGGRDTVPWSLVGRGWTLAQLSGAPAGSAATTVASSATYLVDPEGGRYLMRPWPGQAPPALLAWSGNGAVALFGSESGGGYFLLTLKTGQETSLNLPSDVTVTGFTRPLGENLLAIHVGQQKYRLERYDLEGNFQAVLATLPRRATPPWQGSCGTGCGAISSPDGLFAVWGVSGDEMQLVSNAGGMIRKLHVPNSGQPPSCVPISWWDSGSVLASCAAPSGQSAATQLWLVPVNGSSPQPLTTASGTGSGIGYDTNAWEAGGTEYATQTTASQCPAAPSGPGGLEILPLSPSGSSVPVAIPGSTGNNNAVVATDGGKLLVLDQTSCPGSSSLLWYDPATNTAHILLTAPASGEAGVIAAIPYGAGTASAGN